jgi:hypothetical protein
MPAHAVGAPAPKAGGVLSRQGRQPRTDRDALSASPSVALELGVAHELELAHELGVALELGVGVAPELGVGLGVGSSRVEVGLLRPLRFNPLPLPLPLPRRGKAVDRGAEAVMPGSLKLGAASPGAGAGASVSNSHRADARSDAIAFSTES